LGHGDYSAAAFYKNRLRVAKGFDMTFVKNLRGSSLEFTIGDATYELDFTAILSRDCKKYGNTPVKLDLPCLILLFCGCRYCGRYEDY